MRVDFHMLDLLSNNTKLNSWLSCTVGALTSVTISASRIYANPDDQHVSFVRERFSALSTKVVALEGTSASQLRPEDAMFVNRMTIDDLVGATCSDELKVWVKPK